MEGFFVVELDFNSVNSWSLIVGVINLFWMGILRYFVFIIVFIMGIGMRMGIRNKEGKLYKKDLMMVMCCVLRSIFKLILYILGYLYDIGLSFWLVFCFVGIYIIFLSFYGFN